MGGATQLPSYSPRMFSQVLDRIYRILRMDFRTQFGIAVVPGIGFFVSYGILFAVMWVIFFPTISSAKQPAPMPEALFIASAFIGTFVVHLVVLALYFAAASYAAVNADCGNAVTIRDAYQVAFERAGHFICLILSLYGVCFLPALVLEGCIFGLVTALAPSRQFPPILMVLVPLGVIFLFAALIGGVIVAIRLSLAFPASVFEFLGVRESIKRSWELTRGAAGRIFLIILVVYAVMYIAIMFAMMIVMFVSLLGYVALSGMFAHPGPHTIQILIACGGAVYLGLISIFSACTWTGFATSLSIIYNDQRLKTAASLPNSASAGAQW